MDFYQKSRLPDTAPSEASDDSLVITYTPSVDVFLLTKSEKVCVAFSITTKKGDRFVTGISLNCGMKEINSPIQHILTFGADEVSTVFWDHIMLDLKFQLPKLDC